MNQAMASAHVETARALRPTGRVDVGDLKSEKCETQKFGRNWRHAGVGDAACRLHICDYMQPERLSESPQ